MIEWKFPSNDYGEIKGINDSGVATFRGTPLKSLAREICQNCLDAAMAGKIRVEFSMFTIPSEKLPGRNDLRDTFERCKDFWSPQKAQTTKEFFKNAFEEISKEECTILRISDFNTTGLTGSREEINTDWTNLTKSSGASDKKGTAGGSYGIGKFAPFACSYFSTVFYSTYDIKEEEASQGVARLVTFRRADGQTTQGTGYYGNERNTPIYKQMLLDPNFKREQGQYGTDIFITGYKYSSDTWQKDIIISILDGFLGAIWNEKIEVFVGEIKISKDTLGELMETYRDDLTGYTDKYYEVLISEKTNWDIQNFMGMGEVKLGILLGDPEAPKRVAMVRQTGMKIMDKDRLPGHVPFAGVMFINGDDINEKLRLIENPEHTEWQPDRSKNPFQARALLKEINSYIKKTIEELAAKGSSQSIDAVGVGSFIPDDAAETENNSKEEVVSNKVLEIEKKIVKKKAISGEKPGQNERKNHNKKSGHMEPGGDDKDWLHNGEKTHNPLTEPRPSQPVHKEISGQDLPSEKFEVGLQKFVSICVDKENGKYAIMIIPNKSGYEGIIEFYLSAETQNYEAPIKDAKLIGGTSVSFNENKLTGLTFKQGEVIRISLELDYNDYCSMEVRMYAAAK